MMSGIIDKFQDYRVAILLATYNGEKFLKEQIDSLINQTYQNFICYIHDDGSTDSTVDIINEYKNKYCDKINILDYKLEKHGAKYNFMSMLNYVSEPYVMFCDQDDVWNNNKIEITLKKMRDAELQGIDRVLVFSDLEVVDKNLNIIDNSFMNFSKHNPYENSPEFYFLSNNAPGCTIMLNKNLYQIIRKCNNVDNIVMHDHWCTLVASIVGKISFINNTLIKYRQHNNNLIGSKKQKTILEHLLSMIKQLKNGTYFMVINNVLCMYRNMSYELFLISEIPSQYKKLAYDIWDSQHWNKLKRIFFYRKTGLQFHENNWLWNLKF